MSKYVIALDSEVEYAGIGIFEVDENAYDLFKGRLSISGFATMDALMPEGLSTDVGVILGKDEDDKLTLEERKQLVLDTLDPANEYNLKTDILPDTIWNDMKDYEALAEKVLNDLFPTQEEMVAALAEFDKTHNVVSEDEINNVL